MSAHRGVIWRVTGLHTWLKRTLRVGASSASDWKIASPSRQITPRCGRIQVVLKVAAVLIFEGKKYCIDHQRKRRVDQ